MKSSTVRSAIDPTISESSAGTPQTALRQVISAEWRQSGQADLVVSVRRHPNLLRDRSLLLNLAIEEFRAKCDSPNSTDLEQHCHRFREFGSSIQRSILRQLEAQRYIDGHPELLEFLSTPAWPKWGEEFGSFHVCEELGFGAAAHVYLCLQRDVGDRQVVVKATPFSSIEASVLGRLSHPNIVRIYSTGFVDECNLHYLCMPYCGRSTLSDLLDVAFEDGCPVRSDCIANAAKRWALDEHWPIEHGPRRQFTGFGFRSYVDGVLQLALQIADALEHAHLQNILHGDLKPSNVLLSPDGRPLLLDFNLSQDCARSPVMCGGTLAYMPPEHLRFVAGVDAPQKNHVFDATSDVYSFGALLYELLAGVTPATLPAEADNSSSVAEILLARLEKGVTSIRRHNYLVSQRLETIVLQCLAFDRGHRPTTMAEVKRNLHAEMRSFASIRRTARVRPVLFSAVVGLPLAIFAGAATLVTLQPPRYLANYERGLQLASAGDAKQAADYFTAAVSSAPSFAPARFQLARARIAIGQLDLALDDFGQLARTEGDAHSMSYAGYCFNLKGLPIAAIPWYERAIDSGAASAAIYNNLGASYLDAQSRLPKAERTRLAEHYLLKALQLDHTSTTIQLNIVRHAKAKAKTDPSHNPFCVWRHAQAILVSAPNDPFIQSHIVDWYNAAINFEAASHISETAMSGAEESARAAFAELYQRITSEKRDTATTDTTHSRYFAAEISSSLSRRYFLEPLLLDGAQR